jgi:hypothetical protein
MEKSQTMVNPTASTVETKIQQASFSGTMNPNNYSLKGSIIQNPSMLPPVSPKSIQRGLDGKKLGIIGATATGGAMATQYLLSDSDEKEQEISSANKNIITMEKEQSVIKMEPKPLDFGSAIKNDSKQSSLGKMIIGRDNSSLPKDLEDKLRNQEKASKNDGGLLLQQPSQQMVQRPANPMDQVIKSPQNQKLDNDFLTSQLITDNNSGLFNEIAYLYYSSKFFFSSEFYGKNYNFSFLNMIFSPHAFAIQKNFSNEGYKTTKDNIIVKYNSKINQVIQEKKDDQFAYIEDPKSKEFFINQGTQKKIKREDSSTNFRFNEENIKFYSNNILEKIKTINPNEMKGVNIDLLRSHLDILQKSSKDPMFIFTNMLRFCFFELMKFFYYETNNEINKINIGTTSEDYTNIGFFFNIRLLELENETKKEVEQLNKLNFKLMENDFKKQKKINFLTKIQRDLYDIIAETIETEEKIIDFFQEPEIIKQIFNHIDLTHTNKDETGLFNFNYGKEKLKVQRTFKSKELQIPNIKKNSIKKFLKEQEDDSDLFSLVYKEKTNSTIIRLDFFKKFFSKSVLPLLFQNETYEFFLEFNSEKDFNLFFIRDNKTCKLIDKLFPNLLCLLQTMDIYHTKQFNEWFYTKPEHFLPTNIDLKNTQYEKLKKFISLNFAIYGKSTALTDIDALKNPEIFKKKFIQDLREYCRKQPPKQLFQKTIDEFFNDQYIKTTFETVRISVLSIYLKQELKTLKSIDDYTTYNQKVDNIFENIDKYAENEDGKGINRGYFDKDFYSATSGLKLSVVKHIAKLESINVDNNQNKEKKNFLEKQEEIFYKYFPLIETAIKEKEEIIQEIEDLLFIKNFYWEISELIKNLSESNGLLDINKITNIFVIWRQLFVKVEANYCVGDITDKAFNPILLKYDKEDNEKYEKIIDFYRQISGFLFKDKDDLISPELAEDLLKSQNINESKEIFVLLLSGLLQPTNKQYLISAHFLNIHNFFYRQFPDLPKQIIEKTIEKKITQIIGEE